MQNTNETKATAAMFPSDKINFRTKNYQWKEKPYNDEKVSSPKKTIITLNIWMHLNNKVSKYTKSDGNERNIDKSTITFGDFNTPLSNSLNKWDYLEIKPSSTK